MNQIRFDLKKAANYDNLARKAVFGYDQLFTMVLSLLNEIQNKPANVLVVGSGTGMELITFGNLMPNWNLTGVDPSEEMIKISQAKIDYHKLNDRVKLKHGYIDNLPESEKFDAATLIFVLRFFPDRKKKLSLFQNIGKRLQPGAKLVIIDQYGDPSIDHFKYLLKAWINFMKLEGVPLELAKRIEAQAMEQSFFTEDELLNLLSEAGFEKPNHFYNSFMHGGWVFQKK
ncbi:MAG: class I SAM-dependent methyltransferase [Ignavibacteriae bacterium]|nr:class I SAM-dependent methyltransferase [Ignavibacteriota bacterium]NOG97918.1 class I SAM-dependent methyltransferase [Ignavibacteriota bacterium]